jgi:hypothetical protein
MPYDINGHHEASKEIIRAWKRMAACGSLMEATGGQMTETMPAPKKKKPGKSPRHTMLVRLDTPTYEALTAYIAAQEVPPKRNPVVVSALRQFLARHNLWPPKQPPAPR